MPDINEKLNVKITDMNTMGSGVSKSDGCVIFTAGAVDGDVCGISITEKHKNYCTAEITDIIESSPFRIENDCPYFNNCGGCSLRHTEYAHEAKIKKSTVMSALRKFNITNVQLEDTVCPSPAGYRNKAVFHYSSDFSVGYCQKSSNNIIKFYDEPCRLNPEVFHDIAVSSSEYFKLHQSIFPLSLFIRMSTEGLMVVCLETRQRPLESDIDDFCKYLRGRYPAITGFVLKYCDASGEECTNVISGSRYIENNLFGLTFRISPESFFQVNYEGTKLLFETIKKYASEVNFKYGADLFCGTGIIGITLAKSFPDAKFCGIDINSEAVKNAVYNAQQNDIGNIEFFCGDASEICNIRKPDLIIIDPPRKGCSEKMISVLKSIGAENIIYVSCNPFTLARDISKLTSFGYKAKKATPVNMFPRTEHVETVVMLSHK